MIGRFGAMTVCTLGACQFHSYHGARESRMGRTAYPPNITRGKLFSSHHPAGDRLIFFATKYRPAGAARLRSTRRLELNNPCD